MVVRFFVRVRVIRHQAEVIQVGCDSFQHADYPRAVESNKLRPRKHLPWKDLTHRCRTVTAVPSAVTLPLTTCSVCTGCDRSIATLQLPAGN